MSDPIVAAMNVVLAGLAVVIVGHCYRGYDRNNSRPLAFLGLGIALITFPSFAVYLFVLLANGPAYVDVIAVAQVGGLVAILYAFRGA